MRLNDAIIQIVIVGFICLCGPGLFNAMQGLGGAGSSDASIASGANTALYACFAVFGYFGGPIYNALGNKILMFVGGLTYAIYSLFVYLSGAYESVKWLAILGGALLGVGAGIFWTAQGAMMLAYSTDTNRGKYVSIFWIIFNLGGLLGGVLAFGINFNSKEANKANPASYFVFVALMAVGAVSAVFLLVKPSTVVREDGTQVEMKPAGSAIEEIKGAIKVATNKYMLLLTIFCLASNWGYTWQFNYVNGFLFTIRARGLNSMIYWGSEMLGAFCVGHVLDLGSLSKRMRILIGWGIALVIFGLAMGLSFGLQFGFEEHWDKDHPIATSSSGLIDLNQSSRYAYPAITYALCGLGDAAQITFMYWLIGAAANGDMKLSANFSGYFKGIQSVGAAVSWALDLKLNYRIELIIYLCMWATGFVLMLVAGLLVPEESIKNEEPEYYDKNSFADDQVHVKEPPTQVERSNSEV